MDKFELNILGCGSALPTTRHYPSSQILNVRDKLFMIDCGEGAQLQLRRMKLKFTRVNQLFLSHLHGDHCFGLPGLLSTLGLLGHTGEFTIHAHRDAETVFRPILNYFCRDLPFTVRFHPIVPDKNELIYEDRSIRVSTIPLKHRIPTCGFLFEEKEKSRHINSEMVKFYDIPIREIPLIKDGADFITTEGKIITNDRLTTPAAPSLRYAYCSDTLYREQIIPFIEGVDLLYHEATFDETLKARARETYHTTAGQAATLAAMAQVKQLMIGHFSARYTNEKILLEEAQSIFPNTILAKDGQLIKLG